MIKLALLLSLEETVNEWGKQFQDFIREHGRNPLLWIFFFGLGLCVFFSTYSALNKNQ